LPTSHRVPLSWIQLHACAPIRLRIATEILPEGTKSEPELAALRQEVLADRGVKQTIRKQGSRGAWGQNMLGVAPSAASGIKSVGTVAQYRHLLELGVPLTERSFRLADRLLFRILSNDEDPALLFEYQKAAKTNPALRLWARDLLRQGATAALARAGRNEDPRVRAAAHRVMSGISQFLRSEVSEEPVVREGSRNVLHPDASPPTVFAVAAIAFMPRLQRERAGFVDRLSTYLGRQPPKKTYVIKLGKKTLKPTFQLLGTPLQADASGRPKDLPFALHWIELLARLGAFETSPVAPRILARLLKDCDDTGVWSPRNLRALPKSSSSVADFAFPLESDPSTLERRKTDVTFRLSLIAKLLDFDLEYT
jgi:hypothetical protein